MGEKLGYAKKEKKKKKKKTAIIKRSGGPQDLNSHNCYNYSQQDTYALDRGRNVRVVTVIGNYPAKIQSVCNILLNNFREVEAEVSTIMQRQQQHDYIRERERLERVQNRSI